MRLLLIGLGTASLVLGAAAGTRAQTPAPTPGRAPLAPLIVNLPPTVLSQHPVPVLTPERAERLRKAARLRDLGLLDQAREELDGLLTEVPHHAAVLTEIARVALAKQDYTGVERLGRAERTARRDSLLLGREMATALERLARPKEAAQIALEMWVASPAQADWASGTVVRLAVTDPRSIRESLRRAADRLPGRLDLARGLARIEWQLGDTRAALKTLADADHRTPGGRARTEFAEELLRRSNGRDSSSATEALLDLTGDATLEPAQRMRAATRAWKVARERAAERELAPRVAQALRDVPSTAWPAELVADVARGLRRAGMTDAARALIRSRGEAGGLSPELALEQALTELRDGPPEKALGALRSHAESDPEAAFRYAEALFYTGEPDSALAWYKRISSQPADPFAGAALERIYLIEDAGPRQSVSFGRLAYEEWRGETKRATALADTLYHDLTPGPAWAHVAILLSTFLESAGDVRGALAPLLAVADSLPQDRLAPLARQRAGDLYLLKLKDEARALEQYEECLARYPRAWNAPEVRRRMETLRRERRF